MAQMMQARTEFAAALMQICNERGIDPEVVIDTIKAAILAAYKKDFPEEAQAAEADESIELTVKIDPDTGATAITKTHAGKTVDITPPGFGRIAAQTAKQVILQRVREAEKDAIISEYQDRIGTMTTGMVLRFDGKNVIFDIGRGQGFMPPEEQIRGEFYKMNQRLAVYILDIRETMRGKTIIVSRTTPQLVVELFKREVPEVNSGAVEIKAIAREAGVRTKISVISTQSGVDPVGSCVGQKGVRVQEVINELNNEKIDIIQYADNPVSFIGAALAPAEKLDIDIDLKQKMATVTVPDDQMSLAIGRGGQNVRLAAKLTGFKIDIVGSAGKTLSVTGQEEYEIDQLELSAKVRQALIDAGIVHFYELYKAMDEARDIAGIGPRSRKNLAKAVEAFRQLTTKPQTVEAT
ncbi:transcription termination factor NusA [Microgenomates group bacterium RBG_16_45_19]|nr:MAG: transcription termination factor NusA [Microgenomates group bacterium RBG_16_45_19]